VSGEARLGHRKEPSFIRSFSRSQIASGVATAVDFGLIFGLTEIFKVWYVISVAIGAAAGALTNFLMNRHWSFEATHRAWHGQAVRYAVVSAGSLALNTAGTWAMTEFGHLHYGISVAIVSIAVGFLYNYPLQRWFVFK
jgi:putative flippase GtrA